MMKKIVLTSFLLIGLISLSQEAQAYSEIINGSDCQVAGSRCAKIESETKLNQALRLRNRYYNYTYRIDNGARKSVPNQLWRHRIGRALINVDERSTDPIREGALEEPNYGLRQPGNQGNYRVSNTAKQNWKRAAINYYVDGGSGYTSPEGMNQGVIHTKRDNHQAKRIPLSFLTRGAISKSDVRDAQKKEASIADNSVNKAPTGSSLATPFSNRSGSSTRNFYSPYQRYDVYNPNSYLRTEKMIFGQMQKEEKIEEESLEEMGE
ncbi:MAG TPA: hypothetical protein VIT68_01540 [Candidatus Gracilibacteria bacterium]